MTSAKGLGGSNKNKNNSSSGNASPGQNRRNPNSGSLEDSQSAAAAQTRMAQTQQQVDEVVGIMRSNVEKVLERDRYLSDLDARADALNAGAAEFSRTAVQLKRKYWWKNIMWIIILGIFIMLVVTGLAFWIASYFDGKGGNDGDNTTGKSLFNSTNTNATGGTYQMLLLKVNGTQLNLTPQK